MLVEDAARYGISQLHQLRGRVGRGSVPGLCLLVGSNSNPRLQALEKYSDGFALAQIDLELRGQGDLLGLMQSGALEFRLADLACDKKLVESAHRSARQLLGTTLDLNEYPLLQKELKQEDN
jgi:ATP-dependent DNA helicase RecG